MTVSAFAADGFQNTIDALVDEIVRLFLADDVPWVVGYSGGKDSTATLQLVWLALLRCRDNAAAGDGLPRKQKPVYVISTDTQVENPIVARWADSSLESMRAAAKRDGLPIEPHRLTPELADSFWVNLIGKGYPAPRNKFRWCTERLKIKPSNRFITSIVNKSGEAILVLGTRKAESVARAARMRALEENRVRDRLSPNLGLPGTLVYSPVEDWTNDDVWMFLMQVANPWGWSNKALLNMYAGASDGGECPVVLDTSQPSCGSSRFGCWVCTLVEQDKSMEAMIYNDPAKEWMMPLLELRNALDFRLHEDGDRPKRDFRRMNGRVNLMMAGGQHRVIPGPYTQHARADWLRKLLETERAVRALAPPDLADFKLITVGELDEIRRIWIEDKHEIEDLLPGIYQEVMGEPYPGEKQFAPVRELGPEALQLLREVSADDHEYAMLRDLLAVESEWRRAHKRAGLYDNLDKVMSRYMYRTEEEAVAVLAAREEQRGQMTMFTPKLTTPLPTGEERAREAADKLRLVAEQAPDLLAEAAANVADALTSAA